MRIRDKIRKSLGQIRRDDSVFGSMLYMGDRAGYWEAKARFPTELSSEIEVFVDGRADDNLNAQHEFWQALRRLWLELEPVISDALEAHWLQRNTVKHPEKVNQFKLLSLSIPNASIENAEWEASFAPLSDSAVLTVSMRGPKLFQIVLEQ